MNIDYDFNPPIDVLVREMAGMEKALARKVLRSSTVAAARPLKAAMRSLLPSRTGRLRRSVGHRTLTKSGAARTGVQVGDGIHAILVGAIRRMKMADGTRKTHSRLGLWLDQGTQANYIIAPNKGRARKGGRPKALKLGNSLFYPQVVHPGITATNWMSRANVRTQSQQVEAFHRGMVRALEKYRNV